MKCADNKALLFPRVQLQGPPNVLYFGNGRLATRQPVPFPAWVYGGMIMENGNCGTYNSAVMRVLVELSKKIRDTVYMLQAIPVNVLPRGG
jgi:hypothetical protein